MSGVRNSLTWLIPGMRVKRWLTLIILGAVLTNLGSVMAFQTGVFEWWASIITHLGIPNQYLPLLNPTGMALMVLGLGTMLLSAYLLVRGVAEEIDPEKALRLAEVVNRNRLERIVRGQEIVVVGGGTGLSTMIRGLKQRSGNITAIVTVSDDGGSSGRLQREFGMLPPGDIRNCLVALADEEPLMTALFNYRFRTGESAEGGLGGHSLGNLFLAALTEINKGSFDLAVKDASRVLAVRGQVLPSAVESISLSAEMNDGSHIKGETAIVASRLGVKQISLEPPAPRTYPEVVQAILDASVVVIGPGSVYTSVIPNLLVPEIRDALRNTRAIRVYVCNVMTQPGESDGFSAGDHVAAIVTQTGFCGIDYVLVNSQHPTPQQLERYRRQGSDWVSPDLDGIRALGFEPIAGSFISESNLVRHDSDALAREIFRLLEAGRGRHRNPGGGHKKRKVSKHTPEPEMEVARSGARQKDGAEGVRAPGYPFTHSEEVTRHGS